MRPVKAGWCGTLLCGLPGFQLLDALAVDGEGNVCVATLVNGGVAVISPQGDALEHVPVRDDERRCCAGPNTAPAWP